MNMKQFRYVLVLSEEHSFSKAADVLGITQPSLSQYIKSIETELDVRLFNRDSSQLSLTDAGRAYLAAGRKILAIERELQGRIADVKDYKTGTLVVGASPQRACCLLPAAVARFREKYPGICVVLEERKIEELQEAALHGEFDLSVTTLPVNEKSFIWEHIMSEEILLAVPKNRIHLSAVTMPGRLYPAVSVKDLNGLPFVVLSDVQILQKSLETLCERYELTFETAVAVRSIRVAAAMVATGMGVALIPSSMTELEENSGAITYYSLKEGLPLRDVVVMYQRGQYISGPMREFIDILKQVGSEREWAENH